MPERKIIAFSGVGFWGSVFAKVVADEGHSVKLLLPESAASILNKSHKVPKYPDMIMPSNVMATSDPKELVSDADVVIFASATVGFREHYKEVKPYMSSQTYRLSLSKGLERGTCARMTEIMLEMDPTCIDYIGVLHGPNVAREVMVNAEVGAVIAAYDLGAAERMQSWLNSKHFKIYTSDDVAGVEYGGALKNIMAVGAGILDERNVPSSSKPLYVGRALEEMTRFGVALGAHEATFRSLGVLGDLELSCYGGTTRNYLAGRMLAQGKTAKEIMDSSGLAEGLYALESAMVLATRYSVDTPILKVLYKIVYEGQNVPKSVDQLLGNQPVKEQFRDKGLIFQIRRLAMRGLHKLGINLSSNHTHIF